MKFSEIQYHRPDPERLKAELGELIRQLNEELEQAGYLVVRGRVSRKYYLERTYGDIEPEDSQ